MDKSIPQGLEEIGPVERHGKCFRMFKDKNGEEFVLSPWGGLRRVYKVFDASPPSADWKYEMEIYPS